MRAKTYWKAAGCVVVCMTAVAVLWSRTHMTYSTENDTTGEAAEMESVEFPLEVKETVSQGLSWDAEIIVGDTFDTENFYQSTATMFCPDEEIWKRFFIQGEAGWEESEMEYSSRNGKNMGIGVACQRQNGDVLYVTDVDALYADSGMVYVYNVYDINTYSPGYNMDLFSMDADLGFQSREENKAKVWEELELLGINMQGAEITSEYSLDFVTLKEQEEQKTELGDIEQEERKDLWSEADEGYYYYVEQKYQGLSVYKDAIIEDYQVQEERVPLNIYSTASGINYISIKYWFDFEQSEEKMSFVSFDRIKDVIRKKYEKTDLAEPLIVRNCELVAYPLEIEENTYSIIPVWICTIAMQCTDSDGEGFEQNIYVPINAVTGEEMFEMEG